MRISGGKFIWTTIIGPYLFLGKFVWTNGPESSSKVPPTLALVHGLLFPARSCGPPRRNSKKMGHCIFLSDNLSWGQHAQTLQML